MRHIKERLARQGNKSGQKPKRAYRKNAKAPLAAASREPGNIISPASPERLTLTVDFSAFPEIHARLLILAEEDMRPPELQLLYLLKNGLSELEGKA